MICCDKCQDKQKATHMIGWNNAPMSPAFTNSIALCDKCYVDFMTSFGNFKGAK